VREAQKVEHIPLIGQTEMIMTLPFSLAESQAAREGGEELLAKLNGIAQVVHGGHENVRLGAVGSKNPVAGMLRYFVSGQATIRVHTRFSAAGPISGSTTAPRKVGDHFSVRQTRMSISNECCIFTVHCLLIGEGSIWC
jgi:hypothetical protein